MLQTASRARASCQMGCLRPSQNHRGKRSLFGSSLVVPVSQSLHAHFDISQDALVVHVKSSIVDTIIGDLLFHPDSIGEVTHSRALSLFHRTLGSDGGVVEYTATITNQKRFYLLAGLVERGTSFRMAADIAQFVRDETGLSVYTGSTDTMVSNSVRVLCAASSSSLAWRSMLLRGFQLHWTHRLYMESRIWTSVLDLLLKECSIIFI